MRITLVMSLIALFTSSAFAADFQYRVESKLHYRNSEENRFPVKFPFPPSFLPPGQSQAFLETVDAGEHVEVSTISVAAKWQLSDKFAVQGEVDIIDKYDRNPTSSDYKADIDSFVIRYGEVMSNASLPDSLSGYIQIGKFAKFERQSERRTESYGLASTAFNRFEDSGIEAGLDLPMGLYGKLSYTTGNPVFFRDPNMLAGENGTSQRNVPPENPDPELKSGVMILYDAEIESFDLSENAEAGAALGYKWQNAARDIRFDMMTFYYSRTLAAERSLHGTFYGADLDLLDLGDVPGAAGIRLPAVGEDKQEYGLNTWLYLNNFALFAQYVEQSIAELDRSAIELELSYVFDLPITLTPVIRYSKLTNDFVGEPRYPAPSVWWDWEKTDIGVNFDINENLRITAEYSDNSFAQGSNNETLVTFLWKHSVL